ncbi:YjzC family protein [Streptomyces marispadix]|uniref:YjzC family protein n=1 Tax=Streptomyces marispadix TaxID=2922868 RepID=A0ABS9T3N5_9ACTN|nr:YjzC family protein [Streptomyces marispadix]MCH6163112.1 YjzC family protein [Streptomyces marispadix]
MSEYKPFRPGEVVPQSGIYGCDCGSRHRWSTDVRGHRFPPLPAGCTGSCWTLTTETHPISGKAV